MLPFQTVEAFHLSFSRAFVASVKTEHFCVKGGCNLRFYFGSERYSEDFDLDVASHVSVHELRDKVMAVLDSGGLGATARTYGIARVRPPDLSKAKQTETVQRFKVHLELSTGEDLPTKIEFSRRGMDQPIHVEPVSAPVLAEYRMPPLILPHYGAAAAVRQKVAALIGRPVTQARDILDLHLLSTQPALADIDFRAGFSSEELRTAVSNVYAVEYEQFRDAVAGFLSPESQKRYGSKEIWDQVRLIAVSLIERGGAPS